MVRLPLKVDLLVLARADNSPTLLRKGIREGSEVFRHACHLCKSHVFVGPDPIEARMVVVRHYLNPIISHLVRHALLPKVILDIDQREGMILQPTQTILLV